MKVKLDFITNSSTTCFVVMGANIDVDKIPEKYIKHIQEKHNISDEDIKEYPLEYFDDFIKGSDLVYSGGEEYYPGESVMVGIPFTNMKDDETLKKFKGRVQLQILESFHIVVKPYYIETAWRDG
ncbi:MAG: hypothetical protein KAJ19_21135 [Gammaproteobacteria bacterium]|nr:hypothetical protein [Gammaproteobacteria bacterium]